MTRYNEIRGYTNILLKNSSNERLSVKEFLHRSSIKNSIREDSYVYDFNDPIIDPPEGYIDDTPYYGSMDPDELEFWGSMDDDEVQE